MMIQMVQSAWKVHTANNLFSVKSQPEYMGCSSRSKLYISIHTRKFSDDPEPESTSDVPFIPKFVVVAATVKVRPHL